MTVLGTGLRIRGDPVQLKQNTSGSPLAGIDGQVVLQGGVHGCHGVFGDSVLYR
jgi:hypothetical protein